MAQNAAEDNQAGMAPVIGMNFKSFSDTEIAVVQSMMSLSKRWLRCKWVVCSEDACDMIMSHAPGESGVEEVKFQFKGRLDGFRYRDSVEFPLRVRVFLDILQLIEDFLVLEEDDDPSAEISGHKNSKKGKDSPAEVNPLTVLETHLELKHNSKKPWAMMRDGEPWFGVDQGANKAIINAKLNGQSITDSNHFEIKQLQDSKELQTLLDNEQVLPLSEWWWHTGVYFSRFGLFEKLNKKNQVFELTAWPDFGRLPHHANHIRIAALIGTKPFGTKSLKELTGAKPRQIISLINALWLMSALEVSEIELEAEEEQEDEAEQGKIAAKIGAIPSIFKRIRSKFKL